MITYEIQDHQENQTFTAETLTEITAHYTIALRDQGALDACTLEILNDIEAGKIDNGLLRAVLGFEIRAYIK